MRDAVEADMVETELIPCPFCGNTSTNDTPILVYHDKDNSVVYVVCERCDAQGPIAFSGTIFPFADAADRAKKRWNQRAAQ